MADENCLNILDQGVPIWNQWRRSNPEIVPDLSGAVLKKLDLSYVNFQGCNLKEAVLTSSVLHHADFSRADLTAANLTNAEIQFAKFIDANLAGVELEGTDRSRSDFTGTRFAFRPEKYRRETFLDTLLTMAGKQFVFIVITFSIAILIVILIRNCDRIF